MGNSFSKSNPKYTQNVAIVSTVSAVIIVAVIAVVLVVVLKPDENGGSSCEGEHRFANHRHFFSMMSTEGEIGRDRNGNLMDNGNTIEKGIDTRDESLPYPLTFEAGHEYYSENENAPDWAIIDASKTETWSDHVNTHGSCISGENIVSPEVLVIEGTGVRSIQGINVDVKGLVVRQGAVLMIGGNVNLNTEFILIESGGLFQCGAENLKYGKDTTKEKFTINMETTSLGVAKQGSVASQYSYKWYLPGVTRDVDNEGRPLFTDFNGSNSHISNAFGPRPIAVGFNGNLSLKGYTGGSEMKYNGTWSTRNTSTKERIHNEDDDMSIGLYDTSYACLHGHVEEGSGGKGSLQLQLSQEMKGNIEHWVLGSKIVVTYEPRHQAETTSFPDTLGLPRVWLNFDDTIQRNANQVAVDELKRSDDNDVGCEVCTIASVDVASGVVHLVDPLKFNRSWEGDGTSTWTTVKRNIGSVQSIDVDTRIHVSLLTRPITITGMAEDNSQAGGYNNSLCTYTGEGTRPLNAQDEIGFNGSSGKCVPDFDLKKFSISGIDQSAWVHTLAYELRDQYREDNMEDSKSGDHDYKLAWRSAIEGAADVDSYVKILPEDIYPIHGGSWTLGTHGYSGSNASGGAHCQFRMGSSVDIDGVELYRMGSAANAGKIGRYTLHWHGANYTKSFDEYLPDGSGTHTRNAIFQNSSTWCCPSRSVTIHGTSEVTCKNNTSFLTYGSARFTESGLERFNTFEHELIIANLTLSKNQYMNPAPMFGYSGFSFNSTGAFWLKNNFNNIVRCVVTGLPRGMFWNWPVSQRIDVLSNLVDTCPGDSVRKLPCHGGHRILFGGDNCGTNPSGYFPDYAWVPEKYKLLGLAGSSGAALYSDTNQANPFGHNLMNVTYNSSGFNAYIQTHAAVSNPGVGPTSPFSQESANELSVYAKYTKDAWPNPNFMPTAGMNGQCELITTDEYMSSLINGSTDGDKVFRPYSESQFEHLSGTGTGYCCTDTRPGPGNTAGTNKDECSRIVPVIINGHLSWAGNAIGGNAGGAIWVKSAQHVFNACCSLGRGASSFITSQEPWRTSASYRVSIGVDDKPIRALQAIYQNHVTDAAIMLSDGKMLFTGAKTFFGYDATSPDQSVEILRGEYSNKVEVTPLQEWYFADGITMADVCPASMWTTRQSIMGLHVDQIYIYNVNGDDDNLWQQYIQTGTAQPVLQGSHDLPAFRSLKWPCYFTFNETTENVEVAKIDSGWDNWSICQPTLEVRPELEVIANDTTLNLFTTTKNLNLLEKWGKELGKLRGYEWSAFV